MERNLRTLVYVLLLGILLVVVGILVMATMPTYPGPTYPGSEEVLQVGQSTILFSLSESHSDFSIDISEGNFQASGNIGDGYIVFGKLMAENFLYLEVFHENKESVYGVFTEDGMCFIQLKADIYYSFVVKNGIGLIYEGQLSVSPCIEGKG
jgi:hypothetical protein